MFYTFSSFILGLPFVFGTYAFPAPYGSVGAGSKYTGKNGQCFYNYSMNCRFVFHTKRKISTATHYFALAVVVLIMNNFILETFVQVLHFSVYPAKLMTEVSLFLVSWFVQKYFIFKRNDSFMFRKTVKVTKHLRE